MSCDASCRSFIKADRLPFALFCMVRLVTSTVARLTASEDSTHDIPITGNKRNHCCGESRSPPSVDLIPISELHSSLLKPGPAAYEENMRMELRQFYHIIIIYLQHCTWCGLLLIGKIGPRFRQAVMHFSQNCQYQIKVLHFFISYTSFLF